MRRPSSSSRMEMPDILDYEEVERLYDEYELFMETEYEEPTEVKEVYVLDNKAVKRPYNAYDYERRMENKHVRRMEEEFDGPLPEVEPEDLDDETIERLYDEYDYEREMFMRDGDDESLEEVEPDDLDDETIERLYDEYDHERFMRDKADRLLKWWKLNNTNATLSM
ncbi:hypothetical protein J4E89_010357 [Alternaria sp. Ai002NY15]|nr:hypothetical protein J4E89_010357 [Alternaria sp. Ai002NY15]